MKNKEEKRIDVETLITLCHIINDYEKFIKNLSKLMSNKHNIYNIHKLTNISKGNKVVGGRKYKRFYLENMTVIDEINKHSYISNFINNYYNNKYEFCDNENITFFYKYLSEHKENLEQIIQLLEKIKKLGINNLTLDEKAIFTDKEYKVYTPFNDNFNIEYLDNIEAIPNYSSNEIKYKTQSSDYKIVLGRTDDIFRMYDRKIIVNNLLFSYERLPKTITKESIFDKIVSLKEEKQNSCEAIKNSIYLSSSIDSLSSEFNKITELSSKLDTIQDKDELYKVLLETKTCIDKLKELSDKHDENIAESELGITNEDIKREKQLYLKEQKYLFL